jgi:hypothetical protein
MRFFLLGIAIGILFLFFWINLGTGSKAEQPISFNHQKHLEQGTECNTCHAYYNDETFSGMPKVAVCLECHKDPITQNPEEEKIRQINKKGDEVRWKRVYQQPDHVFFSHRRHVVLGKMECENCHGDIGQRDKPPSRPWVKMTMNWCMDCHAKKKVTNDCLACHV